MDSRLHTITFGASTMQLLFVDGGSCTVPYAPFPRLLNATPAKRAQWEIIGNSRGIHWPLIDEDLSISRLLEEFAAPVSPHPHGFASAVQPHSPSPL